MLFVGKLDLVPMAAMQPGSGVAARAGRLLHELDVERSASRQGHCRPRAARAARRCADGSSALRSMAARRVGQGRVRRGAARDPAREGGALGDVRPNKRRQSWGSRSALKRQRAVQRCRRAAISSSSAHAVGNPNWSSGKAANGAPLSVFGAMEGLPRAGSTSTPTAYSAKNGCHARPEIRPGSPAYLRHDIYIIY
jgi:hypothetical protein